MTFNEWLKSVKINREPLPYWRDLGKGSHLTQFGNSTFFMAEGGVLTEVLPDGTLRPVASSVACPDAVCASYKANIDRQIAFMLRGEHDFIVMTDGVVYDMPLLGDHTD